MLVFLISKCLQISERMEVLNSVPLSDSNAFGVLNGQKTSSISAVTTVVAVLSLSGTKMEERLK